MSLYYILLCLFCPYTHTLREEENAMKKHRKLNLRHLIIYSLTMLILLVFLPLLSVWMFPSLLPDDTAVPYHGEIPSEVKIYRTAEKRYETISFEKYIEGVVASEMPSSFHFEALKAQAVASRTFALGRINAGSKLCDSVHCQVYRSKDISPRTKRAVRATSGQVLTYDRELAASALYFASSGGNTENAEDVFVNATPYLVSVSSSFEPGATHKKEKVSLTVKAFTAKMKSSFPDVNFGTIKKSNIEIKSHSKGGRVKTIKIGKALLSGSDVRRALKLYSTRMFIKFKDGRIIITTSGSGHGVGMSQYGAEGFARRGKDYREILAHYYRGTKVSK